MSGSQLKITILGSGTSQGVPVIGCDCKVCRSQDPRDLRLRTSTLVQKGETVLTVDVGPDFRQQMLKYNPGHLDGILLTHEHNDHVAGLDDIRPYNFKYKMDFPLYGLPRVLENIRNRFAYIFLAEKYPGAPSVILRETEPWEELEIGALRVLALPVKHGNLDILGYLFDNRVAYLTDVKDLTSTVREKLKGVEVLILNALHHTPHHSHLNLEEALRMIKDLTPHQAWLTHVSHHMGLYSEVENFLPKNVKLAYDGLAIEV